MGLGQHADGAQLVLALVMEKVPEAGCLLLEGWDKDVLAWLLFSCPDRMQTHPKMSILITTVNLARWKNRRQNACTSNKETGCSGVFYVSSYKVTKGSENVFKKNLNTNTQG